MNLKNSGDSTGFEPNLSYDIPFTGKHGKTSAKKKFEITSKQYGDSLAKSNAERKGKGFCDRTGQLLITSMKRNGNGDAISCFVKGKKTNHEKWNNQAAASQKSSKKVSTSLAKKIDSPTN